MELASLDETVFALFQFPFALLVHSVRTPSDLSGSTRERIAKARMRGSPYLRRWMALLLVVCVMHLDGAAAFAPGVVKPSSRTVTQQQQQHHHHMLPMSTQWIATIDSDIANIPQNEFAPVFMGGLTVMFGGLIAVIFVGFIIDKRDLYANIVADSYAQAGDDEEFWKSLSVEEAEKTRALLQKMKQQQNRSGNSSESDKQVALTSALETTDANLLKPDKKEAPAAAATTTTATTTSELPGAPESKQPEKEIVTQAQIAECPDFASCVCEGGDCINDSFVGKGFSNATCSTYCSETCGGLVDSFRCGIPVDYSRDTCSNGGICTCGDETNCLSASEVPLLDGGIYSEDECDAYCEERCGMEYNAFYECAGIDGNSSSTLIFVFWCQVSLVVATLFLS